MIGLLLKILGVYILIRIGMLVMVTISSKIDERKRLNYLKKYNRAKYELELQKIEKIKSAKRMRYDD